MLAPVVIQPGALGNAAELRLSRQHCIAVTDPASGQPALARAGHLAQRRGSRLRLARGGAAGSVTTTCCCPATRC